VKEFSVPVIFTVDRGVEHQDEANRRVIAALGATIGNGLADDDGIDWRVAKSVSMEGDGVLVAKVTTPAELIEALDGLHTLALDKLPDTVVAPFVDLLERTIREALQLAAIKRPTS